MQRPKPQFAPIMKIISSYWQMTLCTREKPGESMGADDVVGELTLLVEEDVDMRWRVWCFAREPPGVCEVGDCGPAAFLSCSAR